MSQHYPSLLFALALGAAVAGGTLAAESPAIGEDAAAALANAESNVNMAKKRMALWTTAQNALERAREAARKGDSASVLSQAALATDHAFLGMAQLGYPSTEQ